MSSCLCKNLEGAVLPLLIKSVKDRKDDAIHTVNIDETDHGSGSAAHFHKTSFNGVGGAQGFPKRLRKTEEGQQLWQVSFKAFQQGRVLMAPPPLKLLKSRLGMARTRSLIDGLGGDLDLGLIPPTHGSQKITHL